MSHAHTNVQHAHCDTHISLTHYVHYYAHIHTNLSNEIVARIQEEMCNLEIERISTIDQPSNGGRALERMNETD